MWKKLSVYFISFYIAFLPIQRANAVVPIVAGAAYAIDIAAPIAIRYLASEIAISSVVKAVEVSNAYYAASAKISNAKFLKFFKSKAALGVAAFTGVLATLGYYIAEDGSIMQGGITEYPDNVPPPVAGYVWNLRSQSGATVQEVAERVCVSVGETYCSSFEILPYRYDSTREDLRTINYFTISGDLWAGSGDSASLVTCQYAYGTISTCEDGYIPPSGQPTVVEDSVAQADIASHIQTLPEDQQKALIADSEGVLDKDLVSDLTADDAPPMPDNETPIPDIGDQAWKNAHLIATGIAQSSDSTAPNYVSTSDWDKAYYLANTVANGNDYITGINSGSITAPDTGTSTDTGTGDITIIVDVSGVESRLDTTNQLSQSILDEISLINNSSVSLQTVPDESVATSFWPVKYPDGLLGVLDQFITDMKKTPIFEWLNDFIIDLGTGSIPAFVLCFNVIAGIDFGCYTLQADAYIWSAIKSCMILFSIIVSRRIVFGG
ncbi:hypothetical protein KCG43_10050 [Photobacterium sp. WH24]|uniref:hypothetical protein n=1 Tax=Photobacterium sp. WH24 TaxID=2827237 RepID=UPI001C446DFD|nr:hypothetical protein [Photobacterium sp. WH24]MBV7262332.1 hypothetical protein [Photobacterium sp. WH24]